MDTTISSRRDAVNTIVLLIVIALATNISLRVPNFQNDLIIQAIALITSKGVYELAIKSLFFAINKSTLALRAYWGGLYIAGLWSYKYTLGGKEYCGVWDIKQDVNGIVVVGNGLDDHFQLRTIVRSISPLFKDAGGY